MKTSKRSFTFIRATALLCSFRNRGIVVASSCALCALSGLSHAATVINFDDIPFAGGNPTAFSALAPGYQGLDWSSSWTVSPNDATGWYGGTLQPYSHSGNNFAWNGGGVAYQTSVHGGGTFDITSFWARTWPNISVNVTVHGFLNGVETFTQTFPLTQNYVQVTTNFTGIDRFTSNAQQFLLDDLVVANVRPVPEPSTTAFGLVAITGLCMRRFRRNKSA